MRNHRYGFLRFLVLAAALFVGVISARAEGVTAAKLSDTDVADVKRIEAYLNSLDTVRAKFLQFASDGSYSQGMLYVQRPGKMRIQYDPPVPVLIVATGTLLIYHDTELGQVSHMFLSQSPLAIILREKVSLLGKDVIITKLERDPGVLRLTVARADDPLEGRITLVFSSDPMILKKWTVIDAQGVKTTVSLQGARFGMDLDPELFVFHEPETDQTDHD